MATTDLETRVNQLETKVGERLERLETQVAHLIQHVGGASASIDGAPWWRKIVGVFADDPEFDEAMRLGRAYRESLRPDSDEEGTDECISSTPTT